MMTTKVLAQYNIGFLTVAINFMAARIQNKDGPVAYANEG